MKFQKDIAKFLVNAPAHVWVEVEHHMGLVIEIRAPRIVWGNIKDLTAFNLAIDAEAKNNYRSFRKQHKHSHIRKPFRSLNTRRIHNREWFSNTNANYGENMLWHLRKLSHP